MSTVYFNDDIAITLPYGLASAEGWEKGKKYLRIAGPVAGSYLYSGVEYACDIRVNFVERVTKGFEGYDFPNKLKEISQKTPDIRITVSVRSGNGDGSSSELGGKGFERIHRVVIDDPALKAGYVTMGVVGKADYLGLIVTEKNSYMLSSDYSQDEESGRRYIPMILQNVKLLHEPSVSKDFWKAQCPTRTVEPTAQPSRPGSASCMDTSAYTASPQLTKAQMANAGLANDIRVWMCAGVAYEIADIMSGMPSVKAAGMSEFRVSGLMEKLVQQGAVVASTVNGKKYYTLA